MTRFAGYAPDEKSQCLVGLHHFGPVKYKRR